MNRLTPTPPHSSVSRPPPIYSISYGTEVNEMERHDLPHMLTATLPRNLKSEYRMFEYNSDKKQEYSM